jgi:hypothetical protein
MRHGFTRIAALLFWLGLWAATAHADDPCAGFKWDVAHERALFGGSAQALTAAREAGAAPELAAERLYAISLSSQASVALRVPAGPKSSFDGAFAGFARLDVATPGVYRVSLDQPGWIDLVGAHGAIPAGDFSGQRGCRAPHKVVQFSLPAGEALLQLTGIGDPQVRLTLTRAPAAP